MAVPDRQARSLWRWGSGGSYPQALQAAQQWLGLGVDVRHKSQAVLGVFDQGQGEIESPSRSGQVAVAPRNKRATWLCQIDINGLAISPLYWAINDVRTPLNSPSIEKSFYFHPNSPSILPKAVTRLHLTPTPSTLTPTPLTLHPKPCTPPPKNYTPSSSPQTLNPKPHTPNPAPCTQNPTPQALHPKSSTRNPTP